jgi:hypothetical protein
MALEQDFITVPGQAFACLSIVGPSCPQKTDKFGIKIRGCFSTKDEAEKHAGRLQKEDPTFDIYVVDMFKWLLIPPDNTDIENVHYPNDKLQEIMDKHIQSERLASAMFNERKRGLTAKPIEGDVPYITPGDENSKFYTKPDVPPIPHPADVVEELRKEFPDKTIAELVVLANQKIDAEIEDRRMKQNSGTIVEEDEQ